jgi:hypothetical protein
MTPGFGFVYEPDADTQPSVTGASVDTLASADRLLGLQGQTAMTFGADPGVTTPDSIGQSSLTVDPGRSAFSVEGVVPSLNPANAGTDYGTSFDGLVGTTAGPRSYPAAASFQDQSTLSGDAANGPPLDLSRTNELLQQLLDEVRKGPRTFLPVSDRNTVDNSW